MYRCGVLQEHLTRARNPVEPMRLTREDGVQYGPRDVATRPWIVDHCEREVFLLVINCCGEPIFLALDADTAEVCELRGKICPAACQKGWIYSPLL